MGENDHEIDIKAMEATYNDFLLETIQQLFNREESIAFMVESDRKRPLTLRVNTLVEKASSVIHKLQAKGVNLEPLEWSDVGVAVYNTEIPLGATPEYLSGHYTLQTASSLLPVMALGPQENERVVDLCAAPGGKTTHIAALMRNTGTLFANDVSKDRVLALAANLQRMGVRNAICTNIDGLKLPVENVNRVLLDAPCSGTGVLSKDPMAKRSKDEGMVRRIRNKQKQLILKAFDMINGRYPEKAVLVYSTCSVLVDENEHVVNYLLRKRANARVVETGLPFGKDGFTSYRGEHFHCSLKLTRRFYPHVHNTDGFFVAKIKKLYHIKEEEKKKVEKAGKKEKERKQAKEGEGGGEKVKKEKKKPWTERLQKKRLARQEERTLRKEERERERGKKVKRETSSAE